jgi:hypothetical protein
VSLSVQERNGRWHVYETSTEPWALVTAFRTEEEARAYISLGRIHAGACEVQVGGWVVETLQEDRKCIVCERTFYAGSQTHLRLIRVVSEDEGVHAKYEAKCLDHTRTRFNRDEPV